MVKDELLSLLKKAKYPLSVPEMFFKISANKTTLYRELDWFVAQGLIIEVEFGDGKKRYEVASRNHHHHLVCKTCGKIEDVEVDEKVLLANIKNKTRFQINNHSLEFFGKCVNCQI